MTQSLLLGDPISPLQTEVKCTIGICAYNEERNISGLLDNLLNDQALDKNAEILVVSSGSTDSTDKLVRGYCSRDPRVELIAQSDRLGKSSAMNEIIKRASSEIIFFIPADVLPAPLAIASMSTEFSDLHVGVVCGHPVPVNRDAGFSGYLANLMWRMHNRTLNLLSASRTNTHATGELMAVRRCLVETLPEDTVNDDAYIAVSVASKGLRVSYCESAKVYMKAPTNLLDFLRQRRRIIFGHHAIKRSKGQYPRTLETMAFYDPRKVLRIIQEEILTSQFSVPKFVAALIVESIANILAMFDILSKKQHNVWSVAESTKGAL